jgi:hypothetical protein
MDGWVSIQQGALTSGESPPRRPDTALRQAFGDRVPSSSTEWTKCLQGPVPGFNLSGMPGQAMKGGSRCMIPLPCLPKAGATWDRLQCHNAHLSDADSGSVFPRIFQSD